MATIEGQAKLLAQSIFNIAGGDNSTDIFMATVSRYDASTRDLYVFLDGNGSEVKAIPIGEKYEIGRRVMCSVNNFGNLFAIGQDDKEIQQLMKRAYLSSDEVEAGDSVNCLVELEQKDAVLAYEWRSSMYPDRKRSGIAYSTTDADIGDVIFCRVYDKSGKYSGFLTSGTCTITKQYDPHDDYDFGTALKTGQIGGTSQGAGVTFKQLGGTSSKIELKFYDHLGGSTGGGAPIFVSDYICIVSNNRGGIFVGYRSSSGTTSADLGVDGKWKWQGIGGWNATYTIVAEGSKLYVNDSLVLSNMEDHGWETFIPHWYGKNLNTGNWTAGNMYATKMYADGELVLDLVPVKIKGEPDYEPGNTGYYDLVENVFYPGDGRLEFVA